jgi:RNA polymerase-binding transcription factor DksA
VRHSHTITVKEALLKELDQTFQRDYRQTLSEILTELRIRSAAGQSMATPDSIFAVIRQSRILECKSTSAVVRMRAALERITIGKFGICIRCGRKIQATELERNPLVEVCSSCKGNRITNGTVVR